MLRRKSKLPKVDMGFRKRLEDAISSNVTENLQNVLQEIEESLTEESREALEEARNIPRPVCGKTCEDS